MVPSASARRLPSRIGSGYYRLVNQVEESQKARKDLEIALAALRQERDSLAAQERLSNFASLLPSTLGHKRTRSEPDSPAPPARVSKAARSTPGPFSTSALSEGPASRSSIEVLSAVAADQKAEEPVSPPLFAGLPDPPPRSTRSTTQDVAEVPRPFLQNPRNDSGSPELSRVRDQFGMPSNPLLDAELADLPPTTVPRSEWIPGYRDRRSFRSHDIVPWSAQDIRQTSIWRDDLVDESNVRNLIESSPWEILAAKIDPLTFQGRGWFRHMMRIYASYEDEHLRAYWDSIHAFPQRRSRTGARWKPFLQQVLIGLLRGYCDLLLDPFFLQFPRPDEAGACYPGVKDGADPADLLEVLAITDTADRWRNHYRDAPGDHPALGIARLPLASSCHPLPNYILPLCVR
ncbi:hypothetical protein PPTG_20314 [Phytophthora nicotianae INRA-310]|uniref:Uncharacterized protein n=1 Tax=Phytophthora nicotianae (strain INRA-310) TaxID=761204 RepID=W2P9D6_PHYN3|nr:hypothetical protein PPTG_20314 [Phytophthora nicotianae INRA-310]ETM97436.1 hypothetical protein PPTG_20314 [Phytophthora nicotianae INRA-310]